jgi:aminoglycoside phosphotransferase (APT) family kinase protein
VRVDREANVLVQVSPFDRAFPQLPRLVDPAAAADVLAEGGLAAADTGRVEVSTIRYRPGKRHVLRYALPDGACYFVKVYEAEEYGRILSRVSLLADWLDEQTSVAGMARPVASSEADGTIVFAAAVGSTLPARLAAGSEASSDILRAAGLTLAALHRLPAHVLSLRKRTYDTELQQLVSTTSHIAALEPSLGTMVAALISRMEVLGSVIQPGPLGLAYGDFKADHVFAEDDRLTLIDSDSACLAEGALDVGKLLSDLSFWSGREDLSKVAEMSREFLEGLGPLESRALLRARLFEVLFLVKSTARRVRIFEEGWLEATSTLLSIAEEHLTELEAVASLKAMTYSLPLPQKTPV